MITALITIAAVTPETQLAVRSSRAAFCRALSTVQEGWTREQVGAALGQPDDIWPSTDPTPYVPFGQDKWCYGTNGHHSLPSLGYVVFDRGRVVGVHGDRGKPPPEAVVSDTELTGALRAMYRAPSNEWRVEDDPLRLIQSANLLISKGPQKAFAILEEYCRVVQDSFSDRNWLFWLVRVAFTPKGPTGAFAIPHLSGMGLPPSADMRAWPTFPIAFVDGVPLNLLRYGGGTGLDEPFPSYMREHKKDWTLRTSLITPPDDPFPLVNKLMTSSVWALAQGGEGNADIHKSEAKERALQQVLTLVHNAYRREDEHSIDQQKRFAEDHQAFTALGCRWDSTRQLYVRGDGTTQLAQTDIGPKFQYSFAQIPGLGVTISFARERFERVRYSVRVTERGTGRIPNALLLAEYASNGEQLYWVPLNDPEHREASGVKRLEVISAPWHSPSREVLGPNSVFTLLDGGKFRFVVQMNGRRYESPAFKP